MINYHYPYTQLLCHTILLEERFDGNGAWPPHCTHAHAADVHTPMLSRDARLVLIGGNPFMQIVTMY